MRLAVEGTRFLGQGRLGRREHAEEELGFLGLFDATADRVMEVLLGNALIRLAVVSTDAGSSPDELVYQAVVRWVARDPLGESHHLLTEDRGSLEQIPGMSGLAVGRFLPQRQSPASLLLAPPRRLGCERVTRFPGTWIFP